MNKNKFYVTTPIYYVNSKPHLGTLYSTLLADVAARWHKILGKKVFFLTGTDEHGQKIQEKANEVGKDPKTFVDTMVPPFKRVWKRYNINYDRFIRTTDPDHEKAVTHWIKKLKEQDDIYKAEYTGLYCISCEAFVSVDEAAKDDDGKLLCRTHKRQLSQIAEESYFFRLSAYEEQLLNFYEKNPHFITPKERANEVISFIKSGLKDLSISRKTVKWGIPFPDDPEHTVYVWGDALNNYISAIGYGQGTKESDENFAYWWPADLHIMAKDIVRFHAVYWPAFLMAADIPLPKRELIHGYVLIDKKKMSKSLDNAVDPEQLADWYGVDQVRYYLMRQMAITQDGHFSLQDLENHVTADLANNLGNLLNRTLTLALKHSLKEVKKQEAFTGKAQVLHHSCIETFRLYWEEMNKGFYHVALAALWKFISEINAFFHAQQPWVLAKKDHDQFHMVIAAVCHSLYAVGVMLWPVMPTKMEELLAALGKTLDIGNNYEDELRPGTWDKNFTLHTKEKPLFEKPISRLTEEESSNMEQKEIITKSNQTEKKQPEKSNECSPEISFNDFVKVDLRVGTIKSCVPVEGSSKLYKFEVDLGHLGIRQILAGLAKKFTPEELIGKKGVFVANLAPRKMMGLESQGMMLIAQDDEGSISRITVEKDVKNGSRLT